MASKANHAHAPKDDNYTMIQAYDWWSEGEGKHWDFLTSQVDNLASMGISAMWIPPPNKAANPGSVGFDTYDLYDLGEFDQKGSVGTKYGTKAQLETLVAKAKEAGLVTYIDAVLNHKSGADATEVVKVKMVDEEDRTQFISDEFEIEAWTKFDFPGRNGAHSSMKWNWTHFTATDFDNKTGKKGIFKFMGKNKDWGDADDSTKGNYDYLLAQDIDLKHPEVIQDVNNWACWLFDELPGVAGFRFDAVRHMDEGFMSDLMENLRKKVGKDVFGVGEFYIVSWNWIGRGNAHKKTTDKFKQAGDACPDFDMRTIFDGTLVQAKPIDAVTFVDNHDTQPGQTLDSWVNPLFKPLAYALILLRTEGYPCVFAGDLWGITAADKEEDNREPMNQLGDFVRARKLYCYGETRDYWDHANCLGWVRMGDDNHDPCAVVLSNGDDGSKRMEVGKQHAGETWTDVLGWRQGEVTIGEDGWAEFHCPGMSVSIWTKTDARGRDQFGK